MKSRFILFNRKGVFYSEDTVTRKQHSLRTKDENEAIVLLAGLGANSLAGKPVLRGADILVCGFGRLSCREARTRY